MCHHILRVNAYECRAQPFDQIRAFGSESAVVSPIAIVASLNESDSILTAAAEYCAVQYTVFNMLRAVWGASRSLSTDASLAEIAGGRKIMLFKAVKRDI